MVCAARLCQRAHAVHGCRNLAAPRLQDGLEERDVPVGRAQLLCHAVARRSNLLVHLQRQQRKLLAATDVQIAYFHIHFLGLGIDNLNLSLPCCNNKRSYGRKLSIGLGFERMIRFVAHPDVDHPLTFQERPLLRGVLRREGSRCIRGGRLRRGRGGALPVERRLALRRPLRLRWLPVSCGEGQPHGSAAYRCCLGATQIHTAFPPW